MRMRLLQVVAVALAVTSSCAAENRKEGFEPRGEILTYGLCERGEVTQKYAVPESAGGYATKALWLRITERTDIVPLRPNAGFGYEWRAWGLPKDGELMFSYRVSHPQIVRPDGRVLTESFEELPMAVVDGTIATVDCYVLEDDYELVAGDWEFSVYYEGTLLVSKRFQVRAVDVR